MPVVAVFTSGVDEWMLKSVVSPVRCTDPLQFIVSVSDDNVTLSFLVSRNDSCHLRNNKSIEATAMFPSRYFVRVDDYVKLPCWRVFKCVLEAADQMVVLVEHVLNGLDDGEPGSRDDLTLSFYLGLGVSNEVDLEKLGLFTSHRKKTADRVIDLPLNLESWHVAMLSDFFVSSKTRHLKTAVVFAYVIEKVASFCSFAL